MDATATGTGGNRRSLAGWWRSRYGARMLLEISLCGALLVVYRAIRTFSKDDMRVAFANSKQVIAFESWLGLPFEDNLQGFLLDHPTLIKLLNHYYILFHFPTAIAMLLWLYLRHPERYRPFRNLMAVVTFAALVIHLVFPLAPPRMMTGFVDTMREFGPSIYPKNILDGAANQIAAMPSLHFGWAMIAAIAVITVLNTRWRWLALLHPTLMVLAIIATGNHWWIDAAAAGAIVVGVAMCSRVLSIWIGDRRWSWTALRFQTREGVAKLEAFANSERSGEADGAGSDQSDDEGSALETVD